jgi:hypothetical protein
MKLLLDAGHGLSNRHKGVFDPGAEGNGTTEHAEVEKLRSAIVEKLAGKIAVLQVPNDDKRSRTKAISSCRTSMTVTSSCHCT